MRSVTIWNKYIYGEKKIKSPEYIIKKCKLIKINDNLSCYIKINDQEYKLYLKDVPKKSILKSYFKYLCSNPNLNVKIINEKESEASMNILGILYNIQNDDINKKLIKRYKHLQKKYIYEKIYFRSKILKPYKNNLDTIEEEIDENS